MPHRLTPYVLAVSLILTPSIASAQATATNAAPAAPAPVATAPAVTAPAEPTAPVSPSERPATYTVESGDSLWTIGQKFGISAKKIAKYNDLKSKKWPPMLHPGQVLKLPPAPAATK